MNFYWYAQENGKWECRIASGNPHDENFHVFAMGSGGVFYLRDNQTQEIIEVVVHENNQQAADKEFEYVTR